MKYFIILLVTFVAIGRLSASEYFCDIERSDGSSLKAKLVITSDSFSKKKKSMRITLSMGEGSFKKYSGEVLTANKVLYSPKGGIEFDFNRLEGWRSSERELVNSDRLLSEILRSIFAIMPPLPIGYDAVSGQVRSLPVVSVVSSEYEIGGQSLL